MGRGAVLKKMQNYEPELVQRLGNAIYSAMELAWKRRGQAELMTLEVAEKSTEEMQYLEQNKEWYKVDMEIKEETAEMEIALFESTWAKSFGFPVVLRLDASGPHQGEKFAEWASTHGMHLDLIPCGARHRLGILERNHAVRRRMLEIFKKEMPEVSFEKALLVTGHQRNRLSSVKGSWWVYVFYWKPQTHKLDPFRWRGPAIAVSVEPSMDRKTMVYWIVHGSSLVRATRQQLRFEMVPERYERQSKPSYLPSMKKPLTTRLLEALKPVRGPVRAIDLCSGAAAAGESEPVSASKPASKTKAAPASGPTGDPEYQPERKKARLPQPLKEIEADYGSPDASSTTEEQTESEAKAADKSALDEMVSKRDADLDDHTAAMTETQKTMKRELEKHHPGYMDSSHGVVDKKDDDPPVLHDDVSIRARDHRFYEQAVQAASYFSAEQARRLDGLPPSGRPAPMQQAMQNAPPRGEDGQSRPKQPRIEEIHMVEVTEEEINMAVVESKLSAEEKRAFTEAKRAALVPWHENDAWRPCKRVNCPPGNHCADALPAQVRVQTWKVFGRPVGLHKKGGN
eukprot:s4786_g4.t1